ncbi:Transcriptional regulatory protein moc3 [Teratosphaeria destructans]|uniref:Transcriptional regulatory protein moc3 n=1 Tax=Teratosphaeria destructans TaxID=418781 RepID=A0A9W7T1V7_9PEZI|nr:Transcriptional regulatory protein moc3 [Teratosphaeria destructans]
MTMLETVSASALQQQQSPSSQQFQKRVGQRRYAPKTRTGCLTCKIRRIKCDEAKPHCNRCTSTGRRCDGYTSSTPIKPDLVESIPPALSPDAPFGELERRTFDFFRLRTAPCVSGYFNDPVWDRYVLQASHSEPAIRFAVNALGALHEERHLRNGVHETGANPSVMPSYPLVQYSKALNGLQELLKADHVSMDAVLMCILLMTHFEALRECFVPALLHVEAAIRMLDSNQNVDVRKIDPSLVRSLMRLDMQGSMFLGMRIPGLPFYTAATDTKLPSHLHDLTQARDLINTLTCRLFHFMRAEADEFKFREPGSIPLELLASSHEYVQTFLDLDELLWSFMHKPSVKLSIREQHGLGMLRSRVKINRILAATCLYSETCMYDAFLQEFEDILTICKYIMSSDNADRRLFSVSLDEGLLHPLFFTATHCRDSIIRHQALAQLKKLPANCGVWHVEAMTRTASLCVKLEEHWCDKHSPTCADIPEWRRIHSAGFDGWEYGVPKPRTTTHFRMMPNGTDGEWADFEQAIYWESEMPERLDEVMKKVMETGLRSTNITWLYG